MATTLTSPSLQFSTTPFPSPRPTFPLKSKPHLPFTTHATTDDDPQPESPTQPASESAEDPFESRLSRVRIRYRSGMGKKAGMRKARKGASKSESGIYLPPVPLKEEVSGGLKVEFGFSSHSERINGRIAILGLTTLILVELVAAVLALYIKYEKEKIRVWPQSSPAKE